MCWRIISCIQSSLFIILQVHSTCFGCQPHPSSGVHKTVTTASCTGHIFYAVTSLQRWSWATLEGGSCTVPEAVVTVLCTRDGGCGWHPKHVEWTCRIINRLLCVTSRWTIINISVIFVHWILYCFHMQIIRTDAPSLHSLGMVSCVFTSHHHITGYNCTWWSTNSRVDHTAVLGSEFSVKINLNLDSS